VAHTLRSLIEYRGLLLARNQENIALIAILDPVLRTAADFENSPMTPSLLLERVRAHSVLGHSLKESAAFLFRASQGLLSESGIEEIWSCWARLMGSSFAAWHVAVDASPVTPASLPLRLSLLQAALKASKSWDILESILTASLSIRGSQLHTSSFLQVAEFRRLALSTVVENSNGDQAVTRTIELIISHPPLPYSFFRAAFSWERGRKDAASIEKLFQAAADQFGATEHGLWFDWIRHVQSRGDVATGERLYQTALRVLQRPSDLLSLMAANSEGIL